MARWQIRCYDQFDRMGPCDWSGAVMDERFSRGDAYDVSRMALRVRPVSHTHSSGNDDGAVDSERQVFSKALAAIARERDERWHVDDTGVGVPRRDDASTNVAVEDDRRLPDAHPMSDPPIFLVGFDAVD